MERAGRRGRHGVDALAFASIVDIGADLPFYFTPVYRETESRLRDGNIRHTIRAAGCSPSSS